MKLPFNYDTFGETLAEKSTSQRDVLFSTMSSACAERDEHYVRDVRLRRVMCLRAWVAEHITSLCGKAAKHHCEHSEQHHLPVRANITSSLGNRQQSETEGFFA